MLFREVIRYQLMVTRPSLRRSSHHENSQTIFNLNLIFNQSNNASINFCSNGVNICCSKGFCRISEAPTDL
jgi:hypothetical protein